MAVKGSATVTLSQYRDTKSVTRYYKLQLSSLAAPDKPTNVKPDETPAGWSKSEPACDITMTLYTVDITVFSDGTTYVSDVSKSTSYEAAKEAWNKANNAQGTANEAKKYTDNALNNYGYQYAAEIEVAGDPNTYYPVMIYGPAKQDVMREILVMRGYGDKAPEAWGGHPTTHGIGCTCKIKCNFGGWGGAEYDWRIHELNEMYGHVFAGCKTHETGMMFFIFLRGGGAAYKLYSDMPMDGVFPPHFNPIADYGPSIWYNGDLVARWNGDSRPFYAPQPRTYTDDVIKEVHDRTYIKVATDAYKNANTAQNTATEAAKTADNYISSDSTGIMVSENKGATKETPSNATKNNVLITDKDVQIRNGKTVNARFAKDRMAFSGKSADHFVIKAYATDGNFTEVWTTTPNLIDSDSRNAFDPQYFIADIIVNGRNGWMLLNTTISYEGNPSVWLAFNRADGVFLYEVEKFHAGHGPIYFVTGDMNAQIPGRSITIMTRFSTVDEAVAFAQENGFDWNDLVGVKVQFNTSCFPATVKIGKDAINDNNSFKAFKIGRGVGGNTNAFDVGFDGDTYAGGKLEVEGSVEVKGLGLHVYGSIDCGEEFFLRGPFTLRNAAGSYVSLLDFIYPVGSIYMSVNAANPGDLIGGTWERIQDRFLLSAGNTYAAGNTGGSAKATLPSHTHTFGSGGYQMWGVKIGTGSTEPGNPISGDKKYYAAAKGDSTSNYKWIESVDSKGVSDVSQANMPPYLAVYVWKRIS